MITLYASSSPNVQKILVMLEETELPYRIEPVNVHRGEQHLPQFLSLNPNAKVPVIVDEDDTDGSRFTIFESGAILIYLGEKTGRFLPVSPKERSRTLQWLMVQMTGVGPAFGQFNHFVRFAPEATYALERFSSEMRRLYDLIDTRLSSQPYLAGDAYTIADIATFPWIRTQARLFGETHRVLRFGWEEHPHIRRWFEEITCRTAVGRALAAIDARPSTLGTASAEELDRYFGRGRFVRRLN